MPLELYFRYSELMQMAPVAFALTTVLTRKHVSLCGFLVDLLCFGQCAEYCYMSIFVVAFSVLRTVSRYYLNLL